MLRCYEVTKSYSAIVVANFVVEPYVVDRVADAIQSEGGCSTSDAIKPLCAGVAQDAAWDQILNPKTIRNTDVAGDDVRSRQSELCLPADIAYVDDQACLDLSSRCGQYY